MSRRVVPLLSLFALFLAPLAACGDTPTTTALYGATLSDTRDQPASLAQYRGKPLIVNFWARWCGPCRAEIPLFVKLRQDYRQRGLEIVGIAIEDKTEAVRDFAKAYDMDYPVLLAKDQGLSLMQSLGNSRLGLPFTVAIDRQGRLVTAKLGGVNAQELAAAAEAALK